MHKKMSRLTRAAATTAAVVLVASGAAVAWAPAASATTCRDTGVILLCGAVKNRTGRTMHITLTLGSGSTGFCDVWNGEGGPWSSFWRAPCDQEGWGHGWKG